MDPFIQTFFVTFVISALVLAAVFCTREWSRTNTFFTGMIVSIAFAAAAFACSPSQKQVLSAAACQGIIASELTGRDVESITFGELRRVLEQMKSCSEPDFGTTEEAEPPHHLPRFDTTDGGKPAEETTP